MTHDPHEAGRKQDADRAEFARLYKHFNPKNIEDIHFYNGKLKWFLALLIAACELIRAYFTKTGKEVFNKKEKI